MTTWHLAKQVYVRFSIRARAINWQKSKSLNDEKLIRLVWWVFKYIYILKCFNNSWFSPVIFSNKTGLLLSIIATIFRETRERNAHKRHFLLCYTWYTYTKDTPSSSNLIFPLFFFLCFNDCNNSKWRYVHERSIMYVALKTSRNKISARKIAKKVDYKILQFLLR